MWIMPQIAVQKLLQDGLKELRSNPSLLDEVFEYMHEPMFESDYGEEYVEKIKTWFAKTRLPVLHAWTFNIDRVPCISIHLSDEREDETKAAVGDHWGDDEDGTTGVAVFSCQVDIGIHASKTGDQVLWLYYIISYLLFKYKVIAEQMGIQLHSYGASDWDKRPEYMAENVWTRWIRFRCITENTWISSAKKEFDVEVDLEVESPDDNTGVNW